MYAEGVTFLFHSRAREEGNSCKSLVLFAFWFFELFVFLVLLLQAPYWVASECGNTTACSSLSQPRLYVAVVVVVAVQLDLTPLLSPTVLLISRMYLFLLLYIYCQPCGGIIVRFVPCVVIPENQAPSKRINTCTPSGDCVCLDCCFPCNKRRFTIRDRKKRDPSQEGGKTKYATS